MMSVRNRLLLRLTNEAFECSGQIWEEAVHLCNSVFFEMFKYMCVYLISQVEAGKF